MELARFRSEIEELQMIDKGNKLQVKVKYKVSNNKIFKR